MNGVTVRQFMELTDKFGAYILDGKEYENVDPTDVPSSIRLTYWKEMSEELKDRYIDKIGIDYDRAYVLYLKER